MGAGEAALEGLDAETQQSNVGRVQGGRAGLRGTLVAGSPFGSKPPGQSQHCAEVRRCGRKAPLCTGGGAAWGVGGRREGSATGAAPGHGEKEGGTRKQWRTEGSQGGEEMNEEKEKAERA